MPVGIGIDLYYAYVCGTLHRYASRCNARGDRHTCTSHMYFGALSCQDKALYKQGLIIIIIIFNTRTKSVFVVHFTGMTVDVMPVGTDIDSQYQTLQTLTHLQKLLHSGCALTAAGEHYATF